MARAPILDLLLSRAETDNQGVFLRFEEEVVTWGQCAAASSSAGSGLAALGVAPGDRVALMLANSPDFLLAYFGVLAVGAGPVPINVAQRGAALEHILSDSGSKVAIVDHDLAQIVRAAAPDLVVVVRGTPGFDRLMTSSGPPPDAGDGTTSGLGILYTSGTTGPPKGVVATGYDLSHVHALLGHLGVAAGETVYTPLPLFHGNALILSAMGAVWNGWTVALARRFSASRFWDDTRRYGAVECNALGAMIPILLKQPVRPDDADNPIRTVLSAGCPAWAWREFEERFNVRLLEFYGLVDYPGYLANLDGLPGKMGKPLGATEFAVVDPSGAPVPVDEPGELVMRHPHGRVTHYHNDDAATDEAYRGGWFHTGDQAIVDADGNYTYSGRLKTSMRRRGENISAWEIETVVSSHPAVAECAAHAVPSTVGEDDVKLVVVLQPGVAIAPEELVAYCRGRMAEFAVPDYVEFRADLPKTATHRVKYESLRAEGITPSTWRQPQPSRAPLSDAVGRDRH